MEIDFVTFDDFVFDEIKAPDELNTRTPFCSSKETHGAL